MVYYDEKQDKIVWGDEEELAEIRVQMEEEEKEAKKPRPRVKISDEEFKKKLELAFYGTGGAIVKDYFFDDKNYSEEDNPLDGVIKTIYDWSASTPEHFEHMDFSDKDLFKKTDDEKIKFIMLAFPEEICYAPETAGCVAGALFRKGYLQEVLEILQVHDMTEPRYWDS